MAVEPAAAKAERFMRELRRCLLIMTLVIVVIQVGYYLSGIHVFHGWVVDRDYYVIGRDFLNSWTMARAAMHDAQPGANYDITTYVSHLIALLGPGYVQNWAYPPHYMLLMAPLGMLPYWAGWAVFTVGSVAALATALWRFGPRTSRGWGLAMGLASSYFGVICGQVALLATALQLVFFRVLDRRPVLAGIALGLLSVKPQLGMVYPVFLVATKRWKTFWAAAGTCGVIVGASVLVLGVHSWQMYRWFAIPLQQGILRMLPTELVPTVYSEGVAVDLSYGWAMGIQCGAAVMAMALFFTRAFRRLGPLEQMVIVAAGGVLTTPYLMVYDLLFFSCAIVMYLRFYAVRYERALLLVGCFSLPMLHYMVARLEWAGSLCLPLMLMLEMLYGKPAQYTAVGATVGVADTGLTGELIEKRVAL